MFKIFVLQVFWIAANVLPHNVNDSSANQRVLDNEWIQIRRRVLHNRSHDVDAFATCCVQMEWSNSRHIFVKFSFKSFSMWHQIEFIAQTFELVVNIRCWIGSEVSNTSKLFGDRRDETIERSWWLSSNIFSRIIERWSGNSTEALTWRMSCGFENWVTKTVVTRVDCIESWLEESSRWCWDAFSCGRCPIFCCWCRVSLSCWWWSGRKSSGNDFNWTSGALNETI